MSLFPYRDRPLALLRGDLERLRKRLQDVNSRFPATKRFLAMKGVHGVHQLNREDMRELRDYLQDIYKRSLH